MLNDYLSALSDDHYCLPVIILEPRFMHTSSLS